MIACLVLMVYDGPKGDSEGFGVGDSRMGCGTKKVKTLQDFLTFFANRASKVAFLSTKLF